MRTRFVPISLALLLALPVFAATDLDKGDKKTLKDSVVVLDALTSAPDKGIPKDLLSKAECILVFPNVTKAAFVVGGKGGHGVASCRQPDGTMGSAAFYTIGGGSFGWQAGVQQTDVVMLVMNEGGMKYLLSDKFTIGGEATATAGPVGRTAQAATDAQMHAQILSWSRSQGLFLGAAIDGSVVKPDKAANERLYGEITTGKEILVDSNLSVPSSAKPLMDSIRMHMGSAEVTERR